MKTVLERYPKIDYVIVHWPENTLTPWVAAWGYDEEKGSWCQGHYFCELKDAMKYILRKLGETKKIYEVFEANAYGEDKWCVGIYGDELTARMAMDNEASSTRMCMRERYDDVVTDESENKTSIRLYGVDEDGEEFFERQYWIEEKTLIA